MRNDVLEAEGTPDAGAGGRGLELDRASHRRRAFALLGIGLFQVWLWTTRLVNLVQDDVPRSAGFVAVHAVLYVAAFGAAALLLGLGWRMRAEARA